MSWRIRYNDAELMSDDMTVGELGEVEKVSGVPWSIANPLREVKVAKAFIAVMLLRAGKSETEVVEALEALTLRDLKVAFEFVPDSDAELPEEGSGPVPLSPSSTSRASSRGGRGTGGSRAKSVASA